MPSFRSGATELFYELAGRGPAVVFGHSLGCTSAIFEAQSRALVDAGFSVLLPDYPGHGASRYTGPGEQSMGDLARAVLSLMDSLALGPAHWVGLSQGAMVGLEAALLDSSGASGGRLKSLILMNGSAQAESPEALSMYLELARAIRAGAQAAVADAVIALFFSEATRRERPELVETWRRQFVGTDPEGLYGACMTVFHRRSLLSELSRIRIPTLVVAGELDFAKPLGESEAIQAGIPGARLAVLEGAAHLTTLERPEESSRLILDFIRRQE
jgi:3-oxoadipate enol-lactonase